MSEGNKPAEDLIAIKDEVRKSVAKHRASKKSEKEKNSDKKPK